MIPIFVINLARSPERRAAMERELARAGVAATFVRAVDGRHFGAACRARVAATPLSAGEAALTLSHRKCWRALIASGATHAVVLEDDSRLGEGFRETIALDWTRWPSDLVKLETMFDMVWIARRGAAAGSRALHRLGAEHHGAAAYVISRAGAAKALAATRDFRVPVDVALFGRAAIESGAMIALQLVPAVVVQQHLVPAATPENVLPSTLEGARDRKGAELRRDRPRGWRRVAREARRVAEQALRLARLAPTMRRRVVPWT